jgi:hypothetical protein
MNSVTEAKLPFVAAQEEISFRAKCNVTFLVVYQKKKKKENSFNSLAQR